MPMQSLPAGYRALVIGSSGAIGAAFVAQLQADPRCALVQGLHRGSSPAIDYAREDSIAAAAAVWRDAPPWQLIIVATGVLHAAPLMPEKRLAELAYPSLEAVFRTNVFGPALVLRHFAP
ncbi:MAG TPA: short-chain dehydrogenase, partial [Rubrivivax sp.]|nr:short-chain dehydrogenase [Rubrivivax sp.]